MPILTPHTLEFFSRSAAQTRRVGMRLGGLLRIGDVICLIGDLGSGKTTLVQGVAAGWGSLDQVTSPTFVLANAYRHPGGGRLFHIDAYRLSGPTEAEALDLDTMLATGLLVVEWADHILDALPTSYLRVDCHWIDDERRGMRFSARGGRYRELLAAFRQKIYVV
ncbi:MAG: tRNA (adenosine(37)-N6)-threonylcarbamoyltransferase complex ATPase subunit type 1 TsaE [Anaerolineales bacterium]